MCVSSGEAGGEGGDGSKRIPIAVTFLYYGFQLGRRGGGSLPKLCDGLRVGFVLTGIADELQRILVLPGKSQESPVGPHHGGDVRVHNRERQPRLERHREESRVDRAARGQAEGDVRNAEAGVYAKLLPHHADGPQGLPGGFLLGGYREHQAVDDHMLLFDAVFCGFPYDPLRDGETSLRCRRNPVFIKREADDGRPVLRGEGKDPVHHRLLSINGINDGLADVGAERGFENLRLGGIQLERDVGNRLQGADDPNHHILLVNARRADIDIEDLRPGLDLFNGLAEHIIHVAGGESLPETLLSGRVDALADDPRAVNRDRVRRRADGKRSRRIGLPMIDADRGIRFAAGRRFRFNSFRNLSVDQGAQPLNIGRIRSAAAAKDPRTEGEHLPDGFAEFLRRNVIRVGHGIRKAGVRLHDDRKRRPLRDLLDDRKKLLRAEGTVDAESVNAEPLQGQAHRGDGAAGERAVVFLEGHGHEDGEIAVLFRREDGRFGFLKVRHGLDDHKVRVPSGLHDLGEEVIGLLEGERAGGGQELPQRADVEGGQRFPAGCPGFGSGKCLRGFLREADGRTDKLGHRILCSLKLQPVRAEGIGINNIRTCFKIAAVKPKNPFRLLDIQGFRNRAHGHTETLQHRARAAVEKKHPIL